MKKSYISLFFAGFLLALNIFCWRQVFILSEVKSLKVVFFDVGQGDSAFIETPEGHQIVIDGGPNSVLISKLAEQMPFWDKTIDMVILTHPEKDHMTGILSLLERYDVDYFLWTGISVDNAENKKLAELLEKAETKTQNFLLASLIGANSTKIIFAEPEKDFLAGSVFIDVLHPFEDLSGKQVKNTNDSSVVFKMIFGKNEVLFTGDIGFSVEKKLVESDVDLSSGVLKVAHHGSKYSTSEEFLSKVNPVSAVISSGKNSYGHPTPEVIQRLEDIGVEVLRTDQKGDITMLLDGKNIQIK